jgi:hypothetical protein
MHFLVNKLIKQLMLSVENKRIAMTSELTYPEKETTS